MDWPGIELSSSYCKAGDKPRDPWHSRPSLNVAFVIISLSNVKFYNFDVSKAVEIHVVVCWVIKTRSLVGG